MSVVIASATYWSDWPNALDAAFDVRAKSNRAWISAELEVVPAGETRVVGVGSITALRPTLPAITLPSTSAGLDDQTAKWTVTLHRTGVKNPVSTVLADFPLPISFEPSTTWAEIKINKNGKLPLRDTSVYTKTEVNNLLSLQLGLLNKANASPAYGLTALSVAPVSAADPVAVGANDYASLTRIGITRLATAPASASDPIAVGNNDSRLGFLTPQMYAAGTIGDGTPRALSTVYGTLGAAQAVYSFVTALTQTLDYAANQKMIYEALGYPGLEHGDANAKLNKPMFIPAGDYQFGSDTLSIRNASGIRIDGAGRRATQLFSSAIVLGFDGLWYSQITGMEFNTTGLITAVDLDGNVPGHPYATRGVQANRFSDCRFNGGFVATYAFALTRLGNPGGGAQGSENVFLDCHFDDTTTASFFSTGFNALQNTFLGGNFQGHQKNGIQFDAGSFYMFSVGFQSTYGYTQVINDGFDISANVAGVGDRITIIGCRSESLRFYRGAGSQPPTLISNHQSLANLVGWTATTAYTLNQLAVKTSATFGPKLYRVTTAGTSGGVEPVWPNTGTIADGSAVWTLTNLYAVDLSTTGSGILINNGWADGLNVRSGSWEKETPIVLNTSTSYTVQSYTQSHLTILCDTTTGNQTIELGTVGGGGRPPNGTRVTVKKVTTDANTVTLTSAHGNGIESANLPGSVRGSVTVQFSIEAAPSEFWFVINKLLEPDPQIRRLRANLGTTLVAGDFALSAGWGDAASVAMVNTPKDSRGTITVTSSGTGQGANPTITLTFKNGAWPATPDAVVSRGGGSQRTVPVTVNSISTTALVIRFEGTPVAAETYTISWMVMG